MFSTSTLYNFYTVWMTQHEHTSFVFKVKATNDAHIALSAVEAHNPAYEVVLGGSGNTRSMIRDARFNTDMVGVLLHVVLNSFTTYGPQQ